MSARALHLAEGLTLPLDTVTQTIAILAKRRAGKSYTMRRLAEQLFKASQQVVLVDPKGDQWGLRSASDGKGPGLPIVILGGERGDAPLDVLSGEVVAKLVVEERVSVLLDLSLFRKREVAVFMTDFLENLYRLKAREVFRTPMMLIVDEADAIAPQKPQPGEERMLGAIEDIVRRGGQRGIGCVVVTQRSAVLNKNVLTQAQILVALRTIAPQDLKAMKEWIDVHGEEAQRRTLMDSLPALPIGDAWFWSPGWPTVTGIFKRVHVLPIETFDSGKSPEPGAKPVEPKNLADVDLDAIRRQMAATIEKAKQDDPKELRRLLAQASKDAAAKAKRISELEATTSGSAPVKEVVEVYVPFIPDLVRGQVGDITDAVERFHREMSEALRQHGQDVERELRNLSGMLSTIPRTEAQEAVTVADVKEFGRRFESGGRTSAPTATKPESQRVPSTSAPSPGLGKCERAILTVLVQMDEPLTAGRLTLLTRYRYSGGFKNSLTALRTAGFIVGENTGLMSVTDAGRAAIGEVEPMPTGADLADYWLAHPSFGKCERAILRSLLTKPSGLTADQLCTATGYQYSGGFKNSLTTLRTAGVLVGKNTEVMRASEELFS